MELQAVLNEIEELENSLLKQVPKNLDEDIYLEITGPIETNINRARLGVEKLYGMGFEIGPNLQRLSNDSEYSSMMDGIERHIYRSRAALSLLDDL
jgi:hypothetical protein